MMPADGRVFRHVVEDLARDVHALASETATLAKLEAQDASATLRNALAGIAAGVCLGFGGLIVLLGAFVLILVALGLPPWAAALLVSTTLLGVGAILVWMFYAQLTPDLLSLPRTRQSVRDTLSWLKDGAR